MPVSNKQNKIRMFRKILLTLVLLCAAGCIIFINDYYKAGAQAELALQSDSLVAVSAMDNGTIVFEPTIPSDRGLIFYPGGKVEHTAYAPLLHSLAEKGWTCVLVRMPFRLAILDMDAADGIPERFPEIDSWYLGGHSLGGSMAASYLAEELSDGSDENLDGLILLASYSIADLSAFDLDVYSVYGSEDLVLNAENYETNKEHLPSNTKELRIEGGCHAYFGDYGFQDGDGIPTITPEVQRSLTVDFIDPPYSP